MYIELDDIRYCTLNCDEMYKLNLYIDPCLNYIIKRQSAGTDTVSNVLTVKRRSTPGKTDYPTTGGVGNEISHNETATADRF